MLESVLPMFSFRSFIVSGLTFRSSVYLEFMFAYGVRNINNFRYADDTTLMAEYEEELKSLFMKMKEESGKLA